MEIKELGTSQILERMPSKLNLMEQGIRESTHFLDNLNNMNQSEEEQREHSAPSGNVTSYLSPKEKRLWNSLSSNRRKKYEKNSSAASKATSEVGTASAAAPSAGTLNVNTAANTAGEESASAGAKGTASASAKGTASAGAKGSASAGAKGAATGVGGAATGGVLIAAEAAAETAKKTAQTFKDALQSRVAEQRELQQQMAAAGKKSQQIGQKRSMDEVPFLRNIAFVFAGVLLVVVVFVYAIFTVLSGSYQQQPLGEGVVAVAQQELTLSDSNIGGHKYKDWYGMNADWCMMFVSWCANECGYIEVGCVPRTASVKMAQTWYKERSLYYEKNSSYRPKAGDLVFFLNGMSHVGIVVSYDSAKDQITTIEGNSGSSSASPYHEGSRVTQITYQRTAKSISGFATPAYPAGDISETENTAEK